MRAIAALLLVGLAFLYIGWAVWPAQDTGGPGERSTAYLYVLYAGLASLAVAGFLLVRRLRRK
jgi:hypothetical protein